MARRTKRKPKIYPKGIAPGSRPTRATNGGIPIEQPVKVILDMDPGI